MEMLKGRRWGVVAVLAIFLIGCAVGWVVRSEIRSQPLKSWSYEAEGQEGGSVLVHIKDDTGKEICSGFEDNSDSGYTDLEPHRIADILMQKKCILLPHQKLSTQPLTSYSFTRVGDDGYIVMAMPVAVDNENQIIFVSAENGALYNYQSFLSTFYTVKELWALPKGEYLMGVSPDWWNFLIKSCVTAKDGPQPPSDICSYSIYDRHGKILAKDIYTQMDDTSHSTAWYDPINTGFLMAFQRKTLEQRREFTYTFLSLVNNPSYRMTVLETIADQTELPGKGCGVVITSDEGTITIGGGCLNPSGHAYPLVLNIN
jgi:hypothetical protein